MSSRLIAYLFANTASFESGLKSARRTLRDFKDFSEEAGKKVSQAFLVAGAGVTALTIRQMQQIDANAKQADSLGISTRALKQMQLAAQDAGVSHDSLSGALTIMQRNLFSAAGGAKEQNTALKMMGLNIKDIINLSPDKQFEKLAAGIMKIENPTLRAGAASKIFGKNALELIPLFDEYQKKIDEAAILSDKWGASLNRIDSAKVEQANDAVEHIKTALEGVGNTIAVTVSPAITAISDAIVNAGYKQEDFRALIEKSMMAVATLGDAFRIAFSGVKVTLQSVRLVADDVYLYALEKMKALADFQARVLNKIPGVNIESSISDGDIMKARYASEQARLNMASLMRDNDEVWDEQNSFRTKLAAAQEKSQTDAEKHVKHLATLGKVAGSALSDELDIIAGKNDKVGDSAEKAAKKQARAFRDAARESAEAQEKMFNEISGAFNGLLSNIFSKSRILSPVSSDLGSLAGSILSMGTRALFNGAIPGFATGSDYIPHDMIAKVHKGERITTAGMNAGGEGVDITVINNNGSKVSAQKSRRANGGVDIKIQLDQAMSSILGDPGSRTVDALSKTFGIGPQLS